MRKNELHVVKSIVLSERGHNADRVSYDSALRPVRSLLPCLLAAWTIMASSAIASEKLQPVDYVDPLIDSVNSRWIFFSSASRPFGMVNLSPDTNIEGWWNSSYCYNSDTICGFNHVHAWQLSGPSVMPTNASITLDAGSDFCRSRRP